MMLSALELARRIETGDTICFLQQHRLSDLHLTDHHALTAEEQQFVADSPDPAIYRRMAEGLLTLRDQGLAVFDLGDMLKDVPGTIYADYIHFTRSVKGESPGYRMMAARVADDVAKVWDLKEKAPR